jgi:hypothetical protein
MVGVDSLGRRAMTVNWTEAGVTSETASWLPGQLRPENILADMTLLYWPEATVQESLAASGGRLISGPHRRSVMSGDKEIVRIDYEPAADGSLWSGRLHYQNFAWNYTLDVQSAENVP